MQNKKLLFINILTLLTFIFIVIIGTYKMNHSYRSTLTAKTEDQTDANDTRLSMHVERPDYTYIPKHRNDFAILFHQQSLEDIQEIEIVKNDLENNVNNETIDEIQRNGSTTNSTTKTTSSKNDHTSNPSTNNIQKEASSIDSEKKEKTPNHTKNSESENDSSSTDDKKETREETDTKDNEEQNEEDSTNKPDNDTVEENKSKQSDNEENENNTY